MRTVDDVKLALGVLQVIIAVASFPRVASEMTDAADFGEWAFLLVETVFLTLVFILGLAGIVAGSGLVADR